MSKPSATVEANKPQAIEQLKQIMAALRDPQTGCPWDLKQNYDSIVPHTLEEAYEVADAIAQKDFTELKKELGDLLFQVIFYSRLAEEEQRFNFDDVVEAMCEKLIRRHPHVFGDSDLNTDAAIKANWEAEKAKEREQRAGQPLSALADVPSNLPALSRAQKIQKRAANVGFDWPDHRGAFEKIQEEVLEVKQELDADPSSEACAEEIGDLLFATVNLARHCKQDAEGLLRAASEKFSKRFVLVEEAVTEQGLKMEALPLQQLEDIWCAVKKIKA